MNDPIVVVNKQNCWTVDYQQINALYKDFVPQKELSAEQNYFPSFFIHSDKNSNATAYIPASMPSESPLIIELDKMRSCFQKLSELIQKNCKRASIFYTSLEEIQLNDFCQDQVKPIVNELQFYFEFFRTLFQRDIKEMKDVFESTENELYNSLHAKIEHIKRKSIEIQEELQARIKILEKDVQRCEKQSVDFELKLQHEKEKHKWDSTLQNNNTKSLDYSWISKIEKLEHENVLKNVEKGKSVNTKFDTTNGSQTPLCVTPINKHAFQNKTNVSKTEENHVVSKPVTLQTSPDKQSEANSNKNIIAPGMYKVVTSQESQTHNAKCGLSSTGMNVASSVRRLMNRDSHDKNSVLANSKNSAKKVAVYVRKNKQIDNTFTNVISNNEHVIDVDVANDSKAKNILCVSCMQNVLIPCHDKCLANRRLSMHSNARRTLSTKSRTPKSSDTTYVVLKTRFFEKLAQSKTLDTNFAVSKPKIDVESASKAKNKRGSAPKPPIFNLNTTDLLTCTTIITLITLLSTPSPRHHNCRHTISDESIITTVGHQPHDTTFIPMTPPSSPLPHRNLLTITTPPSSPSSNHRHPHLPPRHPPHPQSAATHLTPPTSSPSLRLPTTHRHHHYHHFTANMQSPPSTNDITSDTTVAA
nr:hypothetical protein [Tanacetum cinerariifolium]